MSQVYFTTDHEWVSIEGTTGTVGITDYAQKALGDIVFIELPQVGVPLKKGSEAAVVESVKAASDVYTPISGNVSAVNDAIADHPALVNESPEEKGWFFKVTLSDVGELTGLMDRTAYDNFLKASE